MKKYILLILMFVILRPGLRADDVIIDAAKKEINRYMEELSDEETPPYYISFKINDVNKQELTASFGKMEVNNSQVQRYLDVDVRVGEYEFDNTHIIRGNPFSFSSRISPTMLPKENNVQALRKAMWFATDRNYKKAVERYQKAKSNQAVKVELEDTSADFSKEEPYRYKGDEKAFSFNEAEWEKTLKTLSAKFNDYDWIYDGKLNLTTEKFTKYFISSEGSEIKWEENYVKLYVIGKTKADDGTSLPIYESYFAFEPSGLPDSDEIAEDIEKMIGQLNKLRNAEQLSRYSGPAILTGEAAAVFFHEIFGHRVEGHREKDPNSSQMFKEAVGERILPDYVDIIFDPTLKNYNGNNLAGHYVFDDEGIKGQRVNAVEDGVFKNYLMSRSPIEGFEHSNGHGRNQLGYESVTRQSNLIIEASETKSKEEMREILIEECKSQGLEYGLLFDKVQEGFTLTGRSLPNSYNVHPVIIYKVFADGRSDEMVRGVNLIGTPMTTFSNILAFGNDPETFNGMCGAESGRVPVSATSPSVLVSYIEVQKKQKSQAKPPILPSPLNKQSFNSK